ncbi:unnamed protein product [Closterium sp. NIES-53]
MLGPARVSGQSRERYFLLVVDDYTWYTTIFPLRSKGRVVDVLIPWIRTVRLQLRERFGRDLPVQRLHSDRGGEFSSNLLRDFCRGDGILQSFTLPNSPQQNGIAEHHIGLVMEVARTSMIHAAASHFLWPFAVREVGDASLFEVWGSCAFVRDTSADKLSPRAIPCVFLGFVPDAPGWQFYHPTSRRVFPSQDVTFDESVPFYHLFPYRSAPPPPPPLFLAPAVGSGAPRGAASGGAASGGAEPGSAESEGAETGDADPGGVATGGGEPGGAEPEGVEPGGAVSEGAESGGRREPASRHVLPICTARRVPRSRPPLVPGTHAMTLRPSSVPLRVPLPAPPESSLPEEEFEFLAAAVPRFACMLLAPEGDPDPPDTPTPRSYAEAITGPYSSQWQAAMDAEMASWKSTGTYVNEVPPPRANIVDGMWILRVKRPQCSPPAFKARYVARGFSQRQGVEYFQTFSPTPKMTTLRVLLHLAAQRDYELHSVDFITAFLQGSLHKEIWLRRPPGFTKSTLAALGFALATADPSLFLRTDTSLPPFYILVYITRDRARHTMTLTHSHMVHQVLQRFGFQFSSPQPTPLSTSHSLSAPPSDESVEPSGPYPELVGCLITSGMGLVLEGRGPVVLTGHANASWVDDSAMQRSSQGYTFSLGSGSVSWRSTRSSLVLSSSCEAEIYAGAMAAQELRWLTYLLTDLGEQPSSPPVLYVDNKAMIALCQEHRLEHRTKHIALQYFLA